MAVSTITERASDFSNAREEWRPIPGYEQIYEASSLGRIRRNCGVRRLRVLKSCASRNGYLLAALSKQGRPKTHLVHRLVLLAFCGTPPKGHETNHKNGDRLDNRLENLEYLTRSQNLRHSYQYLGRKSPGKSGERSHLAKLKIGQVRQIRSRKGESPTALAREFGMSVGAVRSILERRSWKDVT